MRWRSFLSRFFRPVRLLYNMIARTLLLQYERRLLSLPFLTPVRENRPEPSRAPDRRSLSLLIASQPARLAAPRYSKGSDRIEGLPGDAARSVPRPSSLSPTTPHQRGPTLAESQRRECRLTAQTAARPPSCGIVSGIAGSLWLVRCHPLPTLPDPFSSPLSTSTAFFPLAGFVYLLYHFSGTAINEDSVFTRAKLYAHGGGALSSSFSRSLAWAKHRAASLGGGEAARETEKLLNSLLVVPRTEVGKIAICASIHNEGRFVSEWLLYVRQYLFSSLRWWALISLRSRRIAPSESTGSTCAFPRLSEGSEKLSADRLLPQLRHWLNGRHARYLATLA